MCYSYVLSDENEVIQPKFLVSCPKDFVCYREGKIFCHQMILELFKSVALLSTNQNRDLHSLQNNCQWKIYKAKSCHFHSKIVKLLYNIFVLNFISKSEKAVHYIFPLESGKGILNLGCGPKNLSLDFHSYGGTLSNDQMLSATALQFSSTGNSRFYRCNTDGCNGESPTKYYKTTIEGFFLIIVGSFGALGNVLTMIVLTRPSMRSNVNLIFTGE